MLPSLTTSKAFAEELGGGTAGKQERSSLVSRASPWQSQASEARGPQAARK